MAKSYLNRNVFTALALVSLSSCVSISKIRYLEAVGANKNDWEVTKQKDPYIHNFYELSLEKKRTDKDPIAVSLDFNFNMFYLWLWAYPSFTIKASGANVMIVNTDDPTLKKELNSRQKINVEETKNSYKKPTAHLRGDSLLVIEDLGDYTSKPASNQRLYVQYRLKRGQKLKIVTGNKTLDSLFNPYKFIVKTNTRVGFGGLRLLGGI